MKNTKIIKYNWKFITIFITILSLFTSILCIVLFSFFSNGKNKYKDDGIIEIWTTSNPQDLFYIDFNKYFIDDFNETYGKENNIKVKMTTITPEVSIGSDIAIKMISNDKVPNLFIGKPEDSVSLIGSEKSSYLYDLNDINTSEVMDDVSPVFDEKQGKYIKPYFPLMQSGEDLYINNEHMCQVISFLESNNILHFSDEFKNQFFEEKIESKLNMSLNDIDNNSLNFIKETFLKEGKVSLDIFDSYDGVFAFASLMDSIIVNEDVNTFAFDQDLSSTYYLTFNAVKNNYDDWLFNSDDDMNFVKNKNAQNAYQFFLDEVLKYKDSMWFRKTLNTNPTTPFDNCKLSMFVGANFNSKYINSSKLEQIQYNEVSILAPPTSIFNNQNNKFVFANPKTLIPIKFSIDETLKEDIATKEFLNFVGKKLFSNYDFFVNEGYLPPKTNEQEFNDFNDYIQNIDLDKETDKQKSLDKALQSTSKVIDESFKEDNFDYFTIPQVRTTKIFNTIITEANKSYWDSDGDFDAVGYVIKQLNTLGENYE